MRISWTEWKKYFQWNKIGLDEKKNVNGIILKILAMQQPLNQHLRIVGRMVMAQLSTLHAYDVEMFWKQIKNIEQTF